MNRSIFRQVFACASSLSLFREPQFRQTCEAPFRRLATLKPGLTQRLMLLMMGFAVLAANPEAHGQLEPVWSINHGETIPAATVRNEYYNNLGFFGAPLVQETSTIDFNWGFGSPAASIPTDSFTARWVGKIMPTFSELYTFSATAAGGVRIWVDNDLILDQWFEHAESEAVGWRELKAGSIYNLRVEFLETWAIASIRVQWSSTSMPKQLVRFQNSPDGTWAQFGTVLAGSRNGRWAVSAPEAEALINSTSNLYARDGGLGWFYDSAGQNPVALAGPTNNLRYRFGGALAVFPDGRVLVGTANHAVAGNATNLYSGSVYLYGLTGELLGEWPNPEGATSEYGYFGYTLATLPGNRFAASASSGRGRVYIFSAAQPGPPLTVITNPAANSGGNFGRALAALGPDRLLISDHYDTSVLGPVGSVRIYDYSGNLIRTIRNPVEQDFDEFGRSLAVVDDHRFLVSAPYADVVYFPAGPVTNQLAGVVYLFDDTGGLVRTFHPPNAERSQGFGTAIAMLDAGRFVVGAPEDRTGNVPTGRAYLYNLGGVLLGTAENPTPDSSDYFGESIAIIDERRFVIGAPADDTGRRDGGSVYGYDVPLPVIELGSQIPEPTQPLDRMGTFPMFGPTVNPPDAAFWHVPSQKLFAVKPGSVLVSWKLSGTAGTNNWEAVVAWPTNTTRFQAHLAGPTPVDVSDGGTYSNVVLQATTSGATMIASNAQRWFIASSPGDSLLMLSAGHPTNGPIRFQFVRSINWNDPAYLHDDAPATVGSPIVDPAGYHNPACGAPQVVLAAGVYAPAPVFDLLTRTGTIIPVNRDRVEIESDDLVVGFYQFGAKLYDPASGNFVANNIAWPHKSVRFRPQWPTNAPRLVIASQQGTGPLDPAQFVDWELYVQNNPAQAGFNPNDEHALRRQSGSNEAVFALRDDLGTPGTSEPFVLIRYRDPVNGGQWRMKVWQVVAQEAPFFFRYPAQAGSLIQAPFPLPTLAPAPETTGVSGPYFRDRKKFFWARAAGNDGGSAEIVMRYFYPMQPGFFFPSNPPAVGASVPLLDQRAGTPGVPINVRFEAVWPLSVPELRVGETLVKAKNGLPQIAGQSSVEILYQQSLPNQDLLSARLIDPVRTRSVPLSQLPADVQTRTHTGLQYFPTLPPHLETPVSFDPVARRLQLRGTFVEPPAGESYLLLNVLTPRERAILSALSSDSGWQTAVTLLGAQASSLIEVPSDSTGFDSLALTAGDAQATGYVTLAFGNSTNLAAPADPISLSILKVTCPPYQGELKVVKSSNPLAEKLTLRHSGDFAGNPDDFEFEWRTLPPVDGFPSTLPPDQWMPVQATPATGIGAVDFTIAGPSLYTLSDNYFVVRYRRINGLSPCGSTFSAWTAPMLAEGWIKRVLGGIEPFEQRIQDYQDTQVNTIVSMISQAGARAVGDIALNQQAANSAGLIEVYETVLRRGLGLSIEGTPPVDYPPANDALLLAAGRLADLYLLLGNEAYADAADPTIAFGTDDGIYGAQATSIHCFMNQTASLLEEELGLLRGRDDSGLPSVYTHPVYNRFIWNFTRDITGGEVAYALNYNIRNQNGDVSGTIDEADAKLLYPQGHGDAWGHYLTAIKNYYRLLRSPHFTWVPRIEAVIVGGVPVSVDYLDERKFATAAAARARTGAEIVNLTFRSAYSESSPKPWQSGTDEDAERAWSMTDWAGRAAQGAFFDWLVGNAMLPDVDPAHTGIQKIERGTIRELQEIAEAYRQIQEQTDQSDQGNNPLGLARNVVPFDIDPGGIANNKTHFEQINERATSALRNAVAVFDHANASTQLLRRQADETTSFQARVTDGEADFNNRLIEIFGTPYTDDIGPTGTYPTGYAGPDIYHYDYVDSPEIPVGATSQQPTLRFNLTEVSVQTNGALTTATRPVMFHFSPSGFGLEKPATWLGQRNAPGEVQMARSAAVESVRRMEHGVAEYLNLIDQIEDAAESFRAELGLNSEQISIRQGHLDRIDDLNEEISQLRRDAAGIRQGAELVHSFILFGAEQMPKVVGLATDALSVPQAALRFLGRLGMMAASAQAQGKDFDAADLETRKTALGALTDLELFSLQLEFNQQERLRQLEQLVRKEPSARLELAALAENQKQAVARYQAALARGVRLLEDRTRFRQQTAAQVQSYRYKDMAFRVFRSDAIQKYRAQFDLAARYAYLAAKAYDYETCLAPGDSRGPGSAFLTSIIRSRSLGLIGSEGPLPSSGSGDPGLADPLAKLTQNWNQVLKGQLGFTSPQTETGRFSLRNELFRILSGPSGSANWRQTLERHVVANVQIMPEFQRHCIPFSTQPVEPAIVIPFSTTINFGLNFFGWPSGGGDNDYDSTKFATKVRTVGIWFANYNNLGSGMINTPRVYLVPVGLDVMRSPTQGSTYLREWRILDQALPVPFPMSGGQLSSPSYIPIYDSLNEDFAAIRRFGRLRAYHDSGSFNPAETISDTRLIGRSVWNTRWLLIIPGGTLHTDRNEGIQRFINGALRPDGTRDGNGVSDIKLFFQTYAYSGN